MTRILIFFIGLTFFILLPSLAQNGPPAGAMKNVKGMNIARMYGKVIEAGSKKPVEFASVVLLWFNKDSLIAGCLAKENGDFALENLPPYGGYRLRVSFLGYKTFETKVYIVPPNKIDQDLGDLKLEPDEQLLKEVEVTAEKNTFVMSVDRKVYNVDKDLSVKGGTALDVMKNVPTITVDGDGNATLRESAVQIYVDGRPTSLTLQQIPADQIDHVEVISNPSVKFAANTTGGIINIVLKKNTKPGYNGMLMGNIGTGDRYGGMASLNIKQGRFNFSSMYSLNSQINNNAGFTNRTDLYNGNVTDYFNQNNITRMLNRYQFGKLGLDYNINNRNTISFSENVVNGLFNSSDVQNFDFLDSNKDPVSGGFRINNSNSGFINFTTQMLYKKTFPVQGKELTVDANHSYSQSWSEYQFDTHNKDNNGNDFPFSPDMQHNIGGGNSNQYIFQMDYVNPGTEKSKIEMGVRSFYKNSLSYNRTTNYNYTTAEYEKDTILSTNYVIDDMVNAAYFNYSNYTFWNIGYMTGLRFEQTFYKGTNTTRNQSFQFIYPGDLNTIQNSLFPAIYLSKKFGTKNEVQFNLSRKIERPNFFQTMPFVMFADKKNYRIGNPKLKPEFINIAELNYNHIFEKGNWLVSAYGRYSEQPITNAVYPSELDSTVLVNTFLNGKNSFRYGSENTIRWTFFKKLTTTFNLDVFYIYLTSGVINNLPSRVTQGWSYKGKINISYSLPWQMTLQVNGNYEAPKAIINGVSRAVYFMDVSLNKMIATKWIFTANLSDVFNTKRMGSDLTTDYYVQSLSRRRETRYFKFSISYLFGKADASFFKKRTQKNNQSGNSNEGEGY